MKRSKLALLAVSSGTLLAISGCGSILGQIALGLLPGLLEALLRGWLSTVTNLLQQGAQS
jgi:hypothetical protein